MGAYPSGAPCDFAGVRVHMCVCLLVCVCVCVCVCTRACYKLNITQTEMPTQINLQRASLSHLQPQKVLQFVPDSGLTSDGRRKAQICTSHFSWCIKAESPMEATLSLQKKVILLPRLLQWPRQPQLRLLKKAKVIDAQTRPLVANVTA